MEISKEEPTEPHNPLAVGCAVVALRTIPKYVNFRGSVNLTDCFTASRLYPQCAHQHSLVAAFVHSKAQITRFESVKKTVIDLFHYIDAD